MPPRIRTLKPAFFGSPKLCSLPRGTRYTAIGLVLASDDRGRLQLLYPQLRGFVYPAGDVSERQLKAEVGEIVASTFALAYTLEPWSYLWLPGFWEHQVINRPTESSLPAHPDDPYAALPIVAALRKFREDSLSDQGALTPSRAGARSLPIPFPSVPPSTTTAEVADTRRPSKTVDPDAPPEGFDTGLRSALDAAVPRFAALWEQRGGEKPTVRSVAVAIAGRPDRDHLSVLTDLERWALVGGGANREIVDWGRTFATFLRKAPAAAPSRPAGNGSAVNGMRSREQRRADGLAALDSLIANGGAQ